MRSDLLEGGARGLLATLVLGASGCAHQLNLPANRFDSPEARGKTGMARVEFLGVEGANVMSVDTRSGISETPRLSGSLVNYLFGFALGYKDSIDAGVRIQPNAPLLFRFKYQLYGKPESEAPDGNISVAVTAAAGLTLSSSSSGPEATRVDVSALYHALDAGLVAGYRLSRRFLIYAGGFASLFGYSGSSSSKTGSSTSFSGSANQLGYHLGLQWESADLFAKLEISRASASSGNQKNEFFYPGFLLGLRL